MNILYILIGIACQLAGWWIDRDYSLRFIYYRTGEGNTWFTDKYGFLSPTKSYLALLIEQGMAWAAFAIAWSLGYHTEAFLSYMAMLISIGAMHLLVSQLKIKKRLKHDREIQIKRRDSLKALLVPGDREASVLRIMQSGFTIQSNNGRHWPPSMQFLYVDAHTVQEALRPLAEKVYDWLLLPETNQAAIWHDLKFHPKDRL